MSEKMSCGIIYVDFAAHFYISLISAVGFIRYRHLKCFFNKFVISS